MTLFGTSGIRGEVGETITTELAVSVGRALASTHGGPVVVGRDVRESGAWLLDAAVAGIRERGVDVIDLGVVSTPTLARSVPVHDAAAGLVVTASHNPPEDNGFKFWDADGSALSADQRRELEAHIEREDAVRPTGRETKRRRDERAFGRHAERVAEQVGDVGDLTVAVDLGNGTGSVTMRALSLLGCTVEALNGRPDGQFPGRPSEPTAEHCRELCMYVGSTDADLGIAHDGDADRMMAVTETGRFVGGDTLLALFAREAVTAHAGERVAVPVDTSRAVADALADVGASVTRTPVGDTYVAERTREDGVVFGGEPSGAWIWPDSVRCPDGALAACRLASMVADAGSFTALTEEIPSYPIQRRSVSVSDPDAVMEAIGERLREKYPAERVTTVDGVRVELDDGWFLVRASGTQPLVRITAEFPDHERATDQLDATGRLVADARS